MRFNTQTRYAVRFLVFLAHKYGQGLVQIKDVATSQKISVKYLEKIVRSLKPTGLIAISRGIKGGYTLALHPQNINMAQIFMVLESSLMHIECVGQIRKCDKTKTCQTYAMWKEVSTLTLNHLKGITLEKWSKNCEI